MSVSKGEVAVLVYAWLLQEVRKTKKKKLANPQLLFFTGICAKRRKIWRRGSSVIKQSECRYVCQTNIFIYLFSVFKMIVICVRKNHGMT